MLRLDKACFQGIYEESILKVDPKVMFSDRDSDDSDKEDEIPGKSTSIKTTEEL
jgi:hypothetical protein